MEPRIRPVWPGARLLGPALTVRTPPGQQRAVRLAVEQAREGDVLVVDAGGALERALVGDRLAAVLRERGVVGVVVDGAVRDSAGLEELGFAAFAAAVVPTPPLRTVDGEVGGAVTCGGLTVSAGDLVAGDRDGVVVIPAAEAAAILARAEELAAS